MMNYPKGEILPTAEIEFLKNDIGFNVMELAAILDSMADGQRLLDLLTDDDEELLLAREIIFYQEQTVRQITRRNRENQQRIKRLEKLSRERQGCEQPRADDGTRSPGETRLPGKV